MNYPRIFTLALALALPLSFAAAPAIAQAPAASTVPGKAPAAGAAAKPAKTPLIDINTASLTELDAVPQIGPARAKAIIAGRPYKGKDELVSRNILSQGVYEKIRDQIIAKH